MPMQTGCKFYESRTYANGETVRKCDLDLAPEAPWRCPDQCPAYQPRLADVAWTHGSLVAPPTPPEPASVGVDDSVARLLDEAEGVVNAVAAQTRDEVDAEQGRDTPASGGGFSRWLRRWKG